MGLFDFAIQADIRRRSKVIRAQMRQEYEDKLREREVKALEKIAENGICGILSGHSFSSSE